MFQPISFSHYTLRPVCLEDLPEYFALIDNNRKRLEDFFAGTVALTTTMADTELHLKDVISKAAQRQHYVLVVIDNKLQKLIASLQVKSIDWNIPKAELGYYIDGNWEGRGIITQAVALIVRHCFEAMQFNKLYIRSYEANVSSRKVAEKNGFELEGIIKCDYKTTSGRIVDLMYYGLLNPAIRQSESSI